MVLQEVVVVKDTFTLLKQLGHMVLALMVRIAQNTKVISQ